MIYYMAKALNGISTASGVKGLAAQVNKVRVRDSMFSFWRGARIHLGAPSISACPCHLSFDSSAALSLLEWR